MGPDQRFHPFPHLIGRLPGEGQRKDVLGGERPVPPEQLGDPVGDHAGLSGSGAGQDERRALEGKNRLPLLLIQGIEEGGLRGRRSVYPYFSPMENVKKLESNRISGWANEPRTWNSNGSQGCGDI